MEEKIQLVGAGIKHGMEHRYCKNCLAHNQDLWLKDPNGDSIEPPKGTPCTGDLIYAEWTRNNEATVQYDRWRSVWCNKNRTAKTPEGLREGKITEETLEFALGKGYKPVFTIEQLSRMLNMEGEGYASS